MPQTLIFKLQQIQTLARKVSVGGPLLVVESFSHQHSRRSTSFKMASTTLPKDISRLGQEVKLFGKWDTQE